MPLGACNTRLLSTVLIGRQEREGSEGIGKEKKLTHLAFFGFKEGAPNVQGKHPGLSSAGKPPKAAGWINIILKYADKTRHIVP